ncbi:Proteasome subunit alpha type-5 [Armadillidium vulgare]|nr:Proteasome subunit alpha type-5 [Armadillidium vulgare]
MFLTRSEYDRGVNTFSPEGRLFQVEYAIEAIKLGSTVIGIQTNEGVVLAVEKRITSTLMIPSTLEKIVEIDKHVGYLWVSGLVADSRTLVDHARVECANHWFIYNEDMKVESVAQAVSNLAIRFGDSDDDGPACGLSMTLPEALKVALSVLKQVMEEKVSGTNVEVAAVTPSKGFFRYPQAEVEAVISSL